MNPELKQEPVTEVSAEPAAPQKAPHQHVIVYIMILFIAAFLLMALSSMRQQRSNDEAVGKIQHGAAWWFNDHLQGMTEHMVSLGNLGYLAGFIGMLTDSRSFLSYPRHEYFRRILCRTFGHWVRDGLFPEDMDTLKEIVSDIGYHNADKYFGFVRKEL